MEWRVERLTRAPSAMTLLIVDERTFLIDWPDRDSPCDAVVGLPVDDFLEVLGEGVDQAKMLDRLLARLERQRVRIKTKGSDRRRREEDEAISPGPRLPRSPSGGDARG
jgi:hypothetical protein